METLNKKLKRLLTHNEIYLLLEIFSECQGIFSEEEYRKLIDKMVGKLISTGSFSHSLIYQKEIPELKDETLFFNIGTFPEEWTNRYIEKNYALTDPTISVALTQKNKAFPWEEAYQRQPPPHDFRSESEDFGLANGTIISTMSAAPPLTKSLFSVSGEDNSERTQIILETLIPHLHYAVEQIASITNTDLLTPREKEVLALQERKYSRDEIAMKLNLSRRTINFHLDNIFKKFNSPNVSNVIFERFRRGIIIDEF